MRRIASTFLCAFAVAVSIVAGCEKSGAQSSTLTVSNLTSTTIVNTTVSQVDNFDWADSNRPDHNFVGKIIGNGMSVTEPEDMNTHANSSWYALTLSFTNGDQLTFRNDQKDSQTSVSKPIFRVYTPQSGQTSKYTLVQYAAGGKNYFTVLPATPTASWMSTLSDSTLMTSLTIPGTHDTSTWNVVDPLVRTQNQNFGQQLNDGIRFWDIRVQIAMTSDPWGWGFNLVHDIVPLDLTFTDALNAVATFFAQYPNETLIVSIKQDAPPAVPNAPSIQQVLNAYMTGRPQIPWYTGTTLPTLGQARGKVILLRRFPLDSGTTSLGIDGWTNWPNAASGILTSGNQSIAVEDYYTAGGQDKLAAISSAFQSARTNTLANWSFITFTSNDTMTCSWFPIQCAAQTMPGVAQNLMANTSQNRLGIVPMDFYNYYGPFVPLLLGTNRFP